MLKKPQPKISSDDNIAEMNKDLRETNKRLEAQLHNSKADMDGLSVGMKDLQRKIEEVNKENDSLKKENDSLKKEVKELQQRKDVVAPEADQNGNTKFRERMIEVVADHESNPEYKPVDMVKNGMTYKPTMDKDGYAHYLVPESYAKSLVSDNSGLCFYLVGPNTIPYLDVKVRVGAYPKIVRINKRVFRKFSNKSGGQWIESIEEESKD